MTNLLDLQSAYTTQVTTEKDGKLNWVVYNEDRKKLAELPKELNDSQMFAILDFAKEFELQAFNTGMFHMKSQKDDEIKMILDRGNKQLQELRDENARLATKLEKFIISEEI